MSIYDLDLYQKIPEFRSYEGKIKDIFMNERMKFVEILFEDGSFIRVDGFVDPNYEDGTVVFSAERQECSCSEARTELSSSSGSEPATKSLLIEHRQKGSNEVRHAHLQGLSEECLRRGIDSNVLTLVFESDQKLLVRLNKGFEIFDLDSLR